MFFQYNFLEYWFYPRKTCIKLKFSTCNHDYRSTKIFKFITYVLNMIPILIMYEVRSSKNRTIALDCAILITETFWILENFPWVMQTKTAQNGFFPTLIVIAQSLLETTPYPLPRTRFHSFLLMPKEPKSTNSSPPCHWSQIVFWITQKVFVVETNQRQF